MLKLSEEAHRTISTELNFRLSACRDQCGWLDLQCSFTESHWTASMAVVKDLCADLGRNIGQGKALVVMIKQDGLFGAWNKSQTSSRAMPMETLDQLILNGAFQSMSPRMLFNGCGRRYKPHEKRALAVRLGYCLMDFFDRDLSSNRISLLSGTSSQSRSDTLYLSFDSDWPVLAERTNFRAGHPALLSFAKLLLEIEFGDAIPYEISHHEHKTNLATWAELFEMVGMLEEEHCGSYLAAVSGCLLVHRQISEALRLIGTDGKTAEAAIRKSLYTEIVCKLEAGVKESTPPSRMKRQRSISPERATPPRKSKARVIAGRQGLVSSGQYYNGLASPPVDITVGDPRPIPRHQRRTASSSTSGGQFDDDTPGDYSADICNLADSFINTHRDLYDELIEDPMTVPRVKVAVLDTGLDERHPYIYDNSARIREVRNWLPRHHESTGVDSRGHGTHVTSLLLDVAPDCDVYCAHVAETDTVPLPPSQIAKAIDHAVAEWQVDVISMSFGFPDETKPGCDELRAALRRAQAASVLLFASASNIGAHGIPAFPARQSGVFCIYAGDGKGNSSRACPTAREDDVNFLALGEGVKSAWPRYQLPGSRGLAR
ncbi:peptidase S8/S53 domain-containing protein [Chaetomium sp. MPI-SDFR-AT-0129]|nr:peptidase S8/S53 domain-containing protein [Chaetomium sp. MPI-SDFR-AT-0129]